MLSSFPNSGSTATAMFGVFIFTGFFALQKKKKKLVAMILVRSVSV